MNNQVPIINNVEITGSEKVKIVNASKKGGDNLLAVKEAELKQEEQLREENARLEVEMIEKEEKEELNQKIIAEQVKFQQIKSDLLKTREKLYANLKILINNKVQIEDAHQQAINLLNNQRAPKLVELESDYNQALQVIGNSFASRGLYSSGARLNAENELRNDYNLAKEQTENKYNNAINFVISEKNQKLSLIEEAINAINIELLNIAQKLN